MWVWSFGVCGSGVLMCVAGSIQLYASICCIHRPAFSFNVDSFFLGLRPQIWRHGFDVSTF